MTQAARVRSAVLALVVLQALVNLGYAVVVPTWRAPDEPSHFDMVWVARSGAPWPLQAGDRRLHRRIEASYEPARLDLARRHEEPPLAQAEAPPRGERPAFADLAADAADGARNGMFQHPPGYYAAAAAVGSGVLALTPGAHGWSYDQVVLAVRAVGAVAVAGMPALAFAVARRLGAGEGAALAAAAVPVAVPQLAHVAGAVGNDGLLAVLVGGLTVASLRLASGDLRLRTGATIGALAAAGLLTKGFALFAPALVGPAAVLGGWRAHRAGRPAAVRRAVGTTALAAGVAGLGGWWWLRNLAIHGTVQPTGMAVPEPPAGFEPSLPAWLAEAAVRIPASFWGQFGWRQADLPAAAVLAAVTVVVAGVAAAFVLGPRDRGSVPADAGAAVAPADSRSARRGAGGGRLDAALALVPTVAIGGIVLAGAWGYHTATGLLPALQGRYLFGGLAGLAAVAAAGWARLAGRRRRAADAPARGAEAATRWLPVAVLAGAAALHAVAGWVVLARFYGPAEGGTLVDRLAALAAWAPLPRPALGLLALLVLAAGVVSAQRLVAATRARPTR